MNNLNIITEIQGEYFVDIDKKSNFYKELKKYTKKRLDFEIVEQLQSQYNCDVYYKINNEYAIIIELDKINKKRLLYLNNNGRGYTYLLYNSGTKKYYMIYVIKSSDIKWINKIFGNIFRKKYFEYILSFIGGTIIDSIPINNKLKKTEIVSNNNNYITIKHVTTLQKYYNDYQTIISRTKSLLDKLDNIDGFLDHNNEIYFKLFDGTGLKTYLGLDNITYQYKKSSEYDTIKTFRNGEFVCDSYVEGGLIFNIDIEHHNTSIGIRGDNILEILVSIYKTNYNKIIPILKNSFNIDIDEVILYKYENSGATIIFTTKGVYVSILTGKKTIDKILIRNEVDILGIGMIETVKGIFNTKSIEKIIFLSVDGNTIPITFKSTKRTFNNHYGDKMFFMGDDNDLGLFYEALFNYNKRIDVYTNNGIFEDIVLLGGKVLINKSNKTDFYISVRKEYDIREDGYIADYKEFINDFIKLYHRKFSIPIVLQGLVCGGMNIWNFTNINPALFITGATQTGKSTMMKIIKSALGYGENSRLYAAKAITPQFTKTETDDNGIMFIDELTGKINPKVEGVFRDVLNKTGGGIGRPGTNIQLSFSSPLIITGERAMIAGSMNNRFVLVDLINKKYKNKVGYDFVNKLYQYNIAVSLYSKYIEQKDKIIETYNKYAGMLSETFDRIGTIRAPMFTINELFDIGFDVEELKQIMEDTLYNTGIFIKEERAITDMSIEDEFDLLLSRITDKGKAQIRYIEYNDRTRFEVIFIDPEVYQTNIAQIHRIINGIADKYPGLEIKINDMILIFTIKYINGTKSDEAFSLFIEETLLPKYRKIIYN